MFRKGLYVLFLFLAFSSCLDAGVIRRSINDKVSFSQRYMDLKSFAYLVTEKQRWGLIVSSDVSVPEKEIIGSTIREILDNYCKNSEFGWKFVDDCLYVANKRELATFFKQLPVLETSLPDGINKNAVYSGNFESIDFSLLCLFLSSVSGAQIRVASICEPSVMMRVNKMPWKRVLLSIVHFNRYRLTISDFSIFISPD